MKSSEGLRMETEKDMTQMPLEREGVCGHGSIGGRKEDDR
jgi:hypothetical protein